jgi:glutaredoxin
MRLLIGSLVLLFAVNAAGQVYRWTDENGRVVYGSEPPPGAKTRTVQNRINSYSGPPEVQRAAVAPKGATSIVMYATSWCGYCAKARAYFKKNGIAFVEHDVEKSEAAHAEYKRLGGRGVPLIVHGGNVMRGFNESSFEALVARSGR